MRCGDALGGAGPGILDMMRPLPTQQRVEAAAPMPVARKGSGNIAGRVCKGGGAGGRRGGAELGAWGALLWEPGPGAALGGLSVRGAACSRLDVPWFSFKLCLLTLRVCSSLLSYVVFYLPFVFTFVF